MATRWFKSQRHLQKLNQAPTTAQDTTGNTTNPKSLNLKNLVMDLQTVLSKIKEIGDKICDALDEFDESLSEISLPPVNEDTDDNERGHLRDLYNNLQPSLEAEIEKARKVMQEHDLALEQKQIEVKHLEDTLKTKENEYKELQKKVMKSKKNIQKYEEKQKGLQNLEDRVRTCKLLTRTNFAYNKEGHTMGYIKGENPLNFEVFDFDKSQMSQEDITRQIWSLAEKVATQK